MSASILSEIFTRLGLETDAQSFLKGELAAKGVEKALDLVAEAARFVTEQLKEATFGVFEQADSLGKLSQKVGVGVQSLQALQYGASLADVSTETLGHSLTILSKNMAGAVSGNQQMVDTFAMLKVKLTDSTGHLRKTEDVLADLADRFDSMPEGAGKTNAMIQALGKSGAELAPLFKGGAASFREFTEEYKQLHGGFDQAFIDGSEKFHDNLTRIKTAWGGIQATVAEAVLPVLNDVVTASLDWVKANKDVIKVKLKEWIDNAIATVKYWVKSIGDWVDAQGGLNAIIDKAKHTLQIFLTYLAVSEVVAFAAAIDGITFSMKGLRAAIAANPLGLLAIALTEMVTLWIDNWSDISEFFEFVWDRITGGLSNAANWIRKEFDDLVGWVKLKVQQLADLATEANNMLNPFSSGDASTGEQGGTYGGSAADDAAFLASRHMQGLVSPSAAPTLVERGTSAGANLTVAPSITIVQQPGQDNRQLAAFVAKEVDAHSRRTMREAAGGTQ